MTSRAGGGDRSQRRGEGRGGRREGGVSAEGDWRGGCREDLESERLSTEQNKKRGWVGGGGLVTVLKGGYGEMERRTEGGRTESDEKRVADR